MLGLWLLIPGAFGLNATFDWEDLRELRKLRLRVLSGEAIWPGDEVKSQSVFFTNLITEARAASLPDVRASLLASY